eukprot:TRINITY_DN2711_c0_g2_i1.p2 TRINITY_DN2711_c0_g2~~TRINITY_DN2711_c0_g2_i1.p2  ORF type:complete len:204 (+),score=66.19 TRINITY_DN2711_c0_g2_i1:65-613(+)
MEDRPLPLAVAVVGPSRSGKTSLCRRFVGDCFDPGEVPSHGVLVRSKQAMVRGIPLSFVLRDAAGAAPYADLAHGSLADAAAAVVAYDAADPDGAVAATQWADAAARHAPAGCVLTVAGCRSDLGEAGAAGGLRLAERLGCPHALTSASDGRGVGALFSGIAQRWLEARSPPRQPAAPAPAG